LVVSDAGLQESTINNPDTEVWRYISLGAVIAGAGSAIAVHTF
jgi:hypothetical protein